MLTFVVVSQFEGEVYRKLCSMRGAVVVTCRVPPPTSPTDGRIDDAAVNVGCCRFKDVAQLSTKTVRLFTKIVRYQNHKIGEMHKSSNVGHIDECASTCCLIGGGVGSYSLLLAPARKYTKHAHSLIDYAPCMKGCCKSSAAEGRREGSRSKHTSKKLISCGSRSLGISVGRPVELAIL
jgi:hypothetical protein